MWVITWNYSLMMELATRLAEYVRQRGGQVELRRDRSFPTRVGRCGCIVAFTSNAPAGGIRAHRFSRQGQSQGQSDCPGNSVDEDCRLILKAQYRGSLIAPPRSPRSNRIPTVICPATLSRTAATVMPDGKRYDRLYFRGYLLHGREPSAAPSRYSGTG